MHSRREFLQAGAVAMVGVEVAGTGHAMAFGRATFSTSSSPR